MEPLLYFILTSLTALPACLQVPMAQRSTLLTLHSASCLFSCFLLLAFQLPSCAFLQAYLSCLHTPISITFIKLVSPVVKGTSIILLLFKKSRKINECEVQIPCFWKLSPSCQTYLSIALVTVSNVNWELVLSSWSLINWSFVLSLTVPMILTVDGQW